MRSSKSRSRSKANRPRTLGNIINRVFDSSGPEGKVRGTPQQIIEKYQLLARDAQLSNDRVAAENFLQHAEHYTRMLGEATREMAAEQEERQRQQQSQPAQNGNGNGNYNNNGNRDRDRDGNRDQWRDRQDRGDYRPDRNESDASAGAEVIDLSDSDGNLVETPEARPFQQRRDDRGDRYNDRQDRNEPRGDRNEPRAERNEPRADRAEPRNEPRAERTEPRPERTEPRPDRNDRRDRGEFRRDREDRRDQPARETPKTEEPKAAAPAAAPAAPPAAAAPTPAPAPAPEPTVDAPKKLRAPRKPRAEKPKDDTGGDNGPAEAAE
jgi:hypothetical protein